MTPPVFTRPSLTHILCSGLLCGSLLACTSNHNPPRESQEHAIAVMVQQLDKAITNPQTSSITIISQYGRDSRYYVMVRGWLMQELLGTKSQLEAYRQQDEHQRKLQQKVLLLQQALRRIDLE
ncbi:hypothetical protein [Shewanella youngdeokensis]|uniref:Uncharacterized protein n=1 Tax=Shewanella youngdeokensis TaxID=2999068 RepID=A0ABZ0JYY9_9GAMM|nr:hypothetical protein RGE70_15680 [Shewanella sp. DAU334]